MRAMNYMKLFLFVLVATIGLTGCSATTDEPETQRPNILLILTDDLDVRLLEDNLDEYPNLRELAGSGVTFENAFVTNSLCCPSRATILTGLYSHNHGVMTNVPPDGGASEYRSSEPSSLPVWLDEAGYETAYVGKYLNGYDGSYVPPGWDEWRGREVGDYSNDVYPSVALEKTTDLFSEQAGDFVEQAAPETGPFFLQVSTRAPHEPATPPRRHRQAFADLEAPRPPSFNEEDVSDKPDWISRRKLRNPSQIEKMDVLYRNQARSMLAVDEMVGNLRDKLQETGELENTYFIFTSDNGWHMGQHRLMPGKRSAYEEDIRVPLILRGPDVPEGTTEDEMVLNNDFVPTFLDLADARNGADTDGRSLLPLIRDENPEWRGAFLIEAAEHERIHRPAYKAVRTGDYTYVEYENGERELYDLEKDPYQMENLQGAVSETLLRNLQRRLAALEGCRGEECREAEND